MEQKLLTEILPLYKSKKNNSYSMRFRIRLTDPIDADALRIAVDSAIKRYPYFCVRLIKKERNLFLRTIKVPSLLQAPPRGRNLMRQNPITT